MYLRAVSQQEATFEASFLAPQTLQNTRIYDAQVFKMVLYVSVIL